MMVAAASGSETAAFSAAAADRTRPEWPPADGTPCASPKPSLAPQEPAQKSTEFQRFGPGVAYYGYRWYDPATGRWPTRDPIQERGGINLYGFVGNDAIAFLDRLGLATISITINRLIVGDFGVYGTLAATIDDERIAKCCGFPVVLSTIEPPPGVTHCPQFPGTKVWPRPVRPSTSRNGQLITEILDDPKTESVNEGANGRNTSVWRITKGSPPPKPQGMNEEDYNCARMSAISTGNGAIDIHSGSSSLSSAGCVIVGPYNIYRPVTFRDPGSYPALTDNAWYAAPGFDFQESVMKQLQLNAAICCAKRTSGGMAPTITVTFGSLPKKATNHPSPVPAATKEIENGDGTWQTMIYPIGPNGSQLNTDGLQWN